MPYIFAYNSTMLFENVSGWYQVLQIALSAILGLFGVAAALNGHLFRKIPVVLRLALVAGGLGMMVPGALTDVIGLAVVAAIVIFQFVANKKNTAVAA